MRHATHFAMHPGWQIFLKDAGVSATNALRRAGLPDDLFTRPGASLSTRAFFDLWRAIDDEAADPTLPVRLGSAISAETFDAPIFAALCSPDLDTALRRISHYKPLVGPVALHVTPHSAGTTIEVEWFDKAFRPPAVLVAVELIFFVQIARLATRERIVPTAITAPEPPQPADAYRAYFDRSIEVGPRYAVTFSREDARRPFLTANEAMWAFFQPELRRRLSELDNRATFTERVRGALLELLPSGSASLAGVAKKLAVSTRTLQRRLHAEGQRFQDVLDAIREELARHYLASSSMSGAEISFLLGFEEPSSFFRAFHAWTGTTPEQVRLGADP